MAEQKDTQIPYFFHCIYAAHNGWYARMSGTQLLGQQLI